MSAEKGMTQVEELDRLEFFASMLPSTITMTEVNLAKGEEQIKEAIHKLVKITQESNEGKFVSPAALEALREASAMRESERNNYEAAIELLLEQSKHIVDILNDKRRSKEVEFHNELLDELGEDA